MRAANLGSILAFAVPLVTAHPALAKAAGAPKRIGIIASIGETSAKPEVVKRMIGAGTEWFRFNLAHKDKRLAKREAAIVRAAARELGQTPPMLFDLPGGKIRTGQAPAGGTAALKEGDSFRLIYGVREVPSTSAKATVDYPKLGDYAEVGGRVLLHQGKIELGIVSVGAGEIRTRVVRGGTLRGHATVDLVGKDPAYPTMTALDRRKLAIAVQSGATHVGVSMVQNAGQMRGVRAALKRLGAEHVKVVAKIETLSALANLDAISDEADVVMIARGDLRTAVGNTEALHAAEEKISRVAHQKGKLLIDATGFEGPDGKSEVNRVKGLDPAFILLKNTAIDPDPVGIVQKLDTLVRQKIVRQSPTAFDRPFQKHL